MAASEAAKFARNKMEAKIKSGEASAGRVIQQVQSVVPVDSLAPARALRFHSNGTINMSVEGTDAAWNLHRNAVGQVAQRADLPMSFVNKLITPPKPTKRNPEPKVPRWKHDLLAHNLHEIYKHRSADTRYLVRAVDGEARGFLSANYRRLDCRPLLDSFASAAHEMGAVFLDGVATDTRVALKAMLPMVFEPTPNEVMCFGVQFENSDFGVGALYCRPFYWRLWCTNRGTLEDALAQIHLGKRLTEADLASEKTLALDQKTHVSLVDDIVRKFLSANKVNSMCEVIRRANEEQFDWSDINRNVLNHLTKGEQEEAEEMFNSDKVEVEVLPEAKSTWRASNIFSYLAGKAEDPDRKMELERVAGQIIDTHAIEVGVIKGKKKRKRKSKAQEPVALEA